MALTYYYLRVGLIFGRLELVVGLQNSRHHHQPATQHLEQSGQGGWCGVVGCGGVAVMVGMVGRALGHTRSDAGENE